MVRPFHQASRRPIEAPLGQRTFDVSMWIGFVAFLLTSGFIWLLPIEVAQQWAFDSAGSGAFDRFEAVGKVEFLLWSARIGSIIALCLFGQILANSKEWFAYFAALCLGVIVVTSFPSSLPESRSRAFLSRARTIVFRGLVGGWMLLIVGHSMHGFGLRAHDWPFFHFNSGDVVLPNISDSNRSVIRYLQEATPPNARILIASDQKLFFLSYYLRPRTLFHRMHPQSEHVIPLKDQQRKLLAYRLSELTADDLSQMPHDYTLEYFEHPDLVNRSQVLSDPQWISFIRRREKNPALVPSYEVRLRASEKDVPPHGVENEARIHAVEESQR